MRVFVSVDMEGIAGICDRRHVDRANSEYAWARRLMTEEANAVAAASFDAGATAVTVNDSHGGFTNMPSADLDPRTELTFGSLKSPHSMVHGADNGFDVAFFVGYHARAGTLNAVLDHSYSSATVHELRMNGQAWGECEFNAALLGSWGVPVGLAAGDDKFCQQAAAVPGIRTVQVKEGLGNRAATSLHPQAARRRLAAETQEVLAAPLPAPWHIPGPYTLEVDLLTTGMTDMAAAVPGRDRPGPRTVRYSGDDLSQVSRCLDAFIGLATLALRP